MSPVAPIKTVDDAAAAVAELLRRWLKRVLQASAAQWLDAEIDRQRDGVDERRLGMALGLVGRRIGRAELALSAADVAAAQALHPRWRPDMWGTDEAARVALVLATWSGDEAAFAARVDRLCATGELTEHVAALKGFAVFPAPASLLSRAARGGPLVDAAAVRGDRVSQSISGRSFRRRGLQSDGCQMRIFRRDDRDSHWAR